MTPPHVGSRVAPRVIESPRKTATGRCSTGTAAAGLEDGSADPVGRGRAVGGAPASMLGTLLSDAGAGSVGALEVGPVAAATPMPTTTSRAATAASPRQIHITPPLKPGTPDEARWGSPGGPVRVTRATRPDTPGSPHPPRPAQWREVGEIPRLTRGRRTRVAAPQRSDFDVAVRISVVLDSYEADP